MKLAFFSPTNTTYEVLAGIAKGLQPHTVVEWDLTRPDSTALEFAAAPDELVVLGAPVYAGRIPVEAAKRLHRLRGADTPAVVVVVYGNRDYDDALLELRDIALEVGLIPVAGAAFIGEHTANYVIGEDVRPIAQGRPDRADLEKAFSFGQAVRRKLWCRRTLDGQEPLQVPGNRPYRELGERRAAAPATREELCVKCGNCAAVCPVGAVVVADEVETNKHECIMCCAGVKYCPTKARVSEHTWMKRVGEWLSAEYRERKEPEVYL